MTQKIFFIGVGNMGGAILKGLLQAKKSPQDILFFELNTKKVDFTNAIFLDNYQIYGDGKTEISAIFQDCSFKNIQFNNIFFKASDDFIPLSVNFKNCKSKLAL